jgi:hypothetical protein
MMGQPFLSEPTANRQVEDEDASLKGFSLFGDLTKKISDVFCRIGFNVFFSKSERGITRETRQCDFDKEIRTKF